MKRTTEVNRILKQHAETLAIHSEMNKRTKPTQFDKEFAEQMGELDYSFPDSLVQSGRNQRR